MCMCNDKAEVLALLCLHRSRAAPIVHKAACSFLVRPHIQGLGQLSVSSYLFLQLCPESPTTLCIFVCAERADRRKGRTGDDGGHGENWDAGSSASASTMASIRDFDAAEPEEIEDEPWERNIDALYEKRCDSAVMEYDPALGLDCVCPVSHWDFDPTFLAAGPQHVKGLWEEWLICLRSPAASMTLTRGKPSLIGLMRCAWTHDELCRYCCRAACKTCAGWCSPYPLQEVAEQQPSAVQLHERHCSL